MTALHTMDEAAGKLRKSRRCDYDDAMSEAGHIYFVKVGEFIKIGWSSNFIRRIVHMRTAFPQEPKVIGILIGTKKQERALHRHFASSKARGEWFRQTPELMAYIDERTEQRLWTLDEGYSP